jgi:hypothetical protein
MPLEAVHTIWIPLDSPNTVREQRNWYCHQLNATIGDKLPLKAAKELDLFFIAIL